MTRLYAFAAGAVLLVSVSSVVQARPVYAPRIIECDRVCSDWAGMNNASTASQTTRQATRQAAVRGRVYSSTVDVRAMLPNERMEYYAKGNVDYTISSPRRGSVPIRSYETYERAYADGGAVVLGGMPPECERWVSRIPSIRKLFCGCGVAAKVGLDNTSGFWNVAGNFLTLPRASPAPGMVAVTRHHVFVLEHHISGNTWMIYNPNGAYHKTWRQPYNITGWTIVNPNGGMAAIKVRARQS